MMDPCSNIAIKKQSASMTIKLDNPFNVYFAGEMVRGSVKFRTQDYQSVQVLTVYLRGEFYYRKDEVDHVESICIESSPVDYRGAGEGNVELEFCIVLCSNSPTSMVSPLGGIRYRVFSTLVLKENGRLQSLEDSKTISVNRRKQLIKDYSGREVNSVERGGLLCCVGSISARMGVNRVFFLCGRSVVVNGCIFNGTHSSVQSTAISLVQILERQRDGKKLKRTVVSWQKGAILPGKKQVWVSKVFVVPPLPPTDADAFFKTSYNFVMNIQKVTGKIIKLKIPVVIGNVAPNEDIETPNNFDAHHSDAPNQIESKFSHFADEFEGFRPMYVTYNECEFW